MSKSSTILISACLVGIECNYRGECARCAPNETNELARDLLRAGFFVVPICPEQLGGMPTPRPPSELQDPAAEILAGRGRVINVEGLDVTDCFRKGACEAVRLARLFGARWAVLKQKSPSCGYREVYDGRFQGRLIGGRGVAAEALAQEGVRLLDERAALEGWRLQGAELFAARS